MTLMVSPVQTTPHFSRFGLMAFHVQACYFSTMSPRIRSRIRASVRGALGRIAAEVCPGFSLSLYDLLRPRDGVFSPTAPLTVYGRWRQHLARLVSRERFERAGLDDVWATYPGKLDRQLVVIQ